MADEQNAQDICLKLFEKTGEINYYMLAKAIENAPKNEEIFYDDEERSF